MLVKTGHKVDDIGRTLSWSALNSFLQYPSADSALMQEIRPEIAEWAGSLKTNAILADIFDMLAAINSNLVAIGSRKAAKRPKQYPRPGVKNGTEDERHFGSDALPPDELRRWFDEKRAKHAGSSTGDNIGHAGIGRRTAENNE